MFSDSRLTFDNAVLRREIELMKQSHATEIASLNKIISVLERLVPLPPAPRVSLTEAAAPSSETELGTGEPQQFHVAESGEEYEARIMKERALAHSLGVAPWSPAFQEAIDQMRRDILRPRVETDEETGVTSTKQYTEAEADDLVHEAFRLAQSVALNEERK